MSEECALQRLHRTVLYLHYSTGIDLQYSTVLYLQYSTVTVRSSSYPGLIRARQIFILDISPLFNYED